MSDLPGWIKRPRPAMSLNRQMLRGVVRIKSAGDLLGTGFVVLVRSEAFPDYGWPYLVTADHVVRNQVSVEVEAPHPVTGEPQPPFSVTDWHPPLKDELDIRVAALPTGQRDSVLGFWLDAEGIAETLDPHPGAPILYAGVFSRTGRVMVRSGTLGDTEAPVKQRDKNTNHLYEFSGHYVDCRSYEGFSGSPCFFLADYPLTAMPAKPTGITGTPEAKWAYQDKDPVETAHYALLSGIFTAHYDDDTEEGVGEKPVSRLGVGIVLPIQFIREAVETEAAKEERAKWDEERRAAQPNPDAITASVSGSNDEFKRFEELTKQLVNTPKPETKN